MENKVANSNDFDPRKFFTFAEHTPMVLESGEELGPITLAYETFGSLNKDKSNAILIVHAL